VETGPFPEKPPVLEDLSCYSVEGRRFGTSSHENKAVRRIVLHVFACSFLLSLSVVALGVWKYPSVLYAAPCISVLGGALAVLIQLTCTCVRATNVTLETRIANREAEDCRPDTNALMEIRHQPVLCWATLSRGLPLTFRCGPLVREFHFLGRVSTRCLVDLEMVVQALAPSSTRFDDHMTYANIDGVINRISTINHDRTLVLRGQLVAMNSKVVAQIIATSSFSSVRHFRLDPAGR
jgi:hypothetical protein